jgi:hypothetical protein
MKDAYGKQKTALHGKKVARNIKEHPIHSYKRPRLPASFLHCPPRLQHFLEILIPVIITNHVAMVDLLHILKLLRFW